MATRALGKVAGAKACCLSGLTPLELPYGFDEESLLAATLFKVLHQEIENQITSGCEHFVSGMDWGIELVGAEIVLRLREKYPSVKLTCIIPYEEQAAKWNEESRTRYFDVLEQANDMKLVGNRYSEKCYPERDSLLLRMSNRIIAVIDESKQGGKALAERAIHLGLETTLINPIKMGVKHLAGHRNFKLV